MYFFGLFLILIVIGNFQSPLRNIENCSRKWQFCRAQVAGQAVGTGLTDCPNKRSAFSQNSLAWNLRNFRTHRTRAENSEVGAVLGSRTGSCSPGQGVSGRPVLGPGQGVFWP